MNRSVFLIITSFTAVYSFASELEKDRPARPIGVETERCSQEFAFIKWAPGIANNVSVEYFIVQYNTTFKPDNWISARAVSHNQYTAKIRLLPGTNYNFRVTAINKIGAGPPSLHTAIGCRTNPRIPYRNPQNLRSIGNKKGYLVITWTRMDKLEHNGPGFKYSLNVKTLDYNDIAYSTFNWEDNIFEIEVGLSMVYVPYIVFLGARNKEGSFSLNHERKILYSFQDVPKVKVSNVAVKNESSSSAIVSWTWDTLWLVENVMVDQIRGKLKGFKIQYWIANKLANTGREIEVQIHIPLTPIVNKARMDIAKVEALYNITDLTPSTSIQIQVCVINEYYAGAPSEVISFTTLEQAEEEEVEKNQLFGQIIAAIIGAAISLFVVAVVALMIHFRRVTVSKRSAENRQSRGVMSKSSAITSSSMLNHGLEIDKTSDRKNVMPLQNRGLKTERKHGIAVIEEHYEPIDEDEELD